MNSTSIFLVLIMVSLAYGQSNNFNSSLCTDIQISELHYYINTQNSDNDIERHTQNGRIVYNLCRHVEVYCYYLNSVLVDSLVNVDDANKTCTSYKQLNITYIDRNDAKKGIKVFYISSDTLNNTISMDYPCDSSSSIGCPSVEAGTIWQYFNRNIILYTIIIQVLGVLLMVLGIWIYRVSIVLVGAGTFFLLLLMIQSFFVFLKGVPDGLISNVLILSIISSLLVGYVLIYFPNSGVFCMGLWMGLILTLTLNNVAFYFIDSNPQNLILYIVGPILSVAGGILTLCMKRSFIIFTSSLLGAYLCLRALSWSLGTFPNELQLSKKYHLGMTSTVPWQFYLYVIALLILTASSSALQSWLFKKKQLLTNQDGNIQQHIAKQQQEMQKQREGLTEFRKMLNGQQQPKQPRVLVAKFRQQSNNSARSSSVVISDQQSNQEQQDQNNQQDLSEELQKYQGSSSRSASPRLKQKLIDRRKK